MRSYDISTEFSFNSVKRIIFFQNRGKERLLHSTTQIYYIVIKISVVSIKTPSKSHQPPFKMWDKYLKKKHMFVYPRNWITKICKWFKDMCGSNWH